jgi:Domain of unknown function (DUF6458)
MGIGVGLILVAVGAVLAFAVHHHTNGFDINTIGYILLAVGAFGILISMIFWSSWAGPGYWSNRRRGTYVEEGPPGY